MKTKKSILHTTGQIDFQFWGATILKNSYNIPQLLDKIFTNRFTRVEYYEN